MDSQDFYEKSSQMSLISFALKCKQGVIGLPAGQRRIKWRSNKARDLVEACFRGRIPGCIRLLAVKGQEAVRTAKLVGNHAVINAVLERLLVDGQQRGNALQSVLLRRPFVTRGGSEERWAVSFDPLVGAFETTSTNTEANPRWVPDIAILFDEVRPEDDEQGLDQVEVAFREWAARLDADRARNGQAALDLIEKRTARDNLRRLKTCFNRDIPVIEIAEHTPAVEVADSFAAANGAGVPVTNNESLHFRLAATTRGVETALQEYEKHARAADATLPSLTPDRLLRVASAAAFGRVGAQETSLKIEGREVLRGPSDDTLAARNRTAFLEALRVVGGREGWAEFTRVLRGAAGLTDPTWCPRGDALVYTYAVYAIGTLRHEVAPADLNPLIGRLFWLAALNACGSPNRLLDRDIRRLWEAPDDRGYLTLLNARLQEGFTSEFFDQKVPELLRGAATREKAILKCFLACQIQRNTPLLFSTVPMAQAREHVKLVGRHRSPELHHLFPEKHLEKLGVDKKSWSRAANLALATPDDNRRMQDMPPSRYVGAMMTELLALHVPQELVFAQHALPEDFARLHTAEHYARFLDEREALMALIIRQVLHRPAVAQPSQASGRRAA